jgi:hypothetical protein
VDATCDLGGRKKKSIPSPGREIAWVEEKYLEGGHTTHLREMRFFYFNPIFICNL